MATRNATRHAPSPSGRRGWGEHESKQEQTAAPDGGSKQMQGIRRNRRLPSHRLCRRMGEQTKRDRCYETDQRSCDQATATPGWSPPEGDRDRRNDE